VRHRVSDESQVKPEGKGEKQPAQCSCVKDAFAALPPDLRPRPKKSGSLRKVTCPGCGLAFWTNRRTDLCMECEAQGEETSQHVGGE
jgi:hypothetical protein